MQSISIDRTDQRIGLFDRGWPVPRAPQRRYYELHLDERGTTTWRRWRRSTTSNCLCRIHQTACSLFISLSGFRRLRARARGPARARSQPGRRKATPATENDLSSPQTAVVRMSPTYEAPGRQYPAWLCRSASALTCFEREEIANSVRCVLSVGALQGVRRSRCVFFSWARALRPRRANGSADGWELLRPRPPPRGTAHGRAGRAAGTQVGTGAVPELPKTPLGLVGLVVVAGGSGTARYWAVWAWGMDDLVELPDTR